MFIFILSITTLAIAAIAAFYSVYGLAALFTGAAIPIIIMGSVLEAGKLVAASYLYRFWKQTHVLIKSYLFVAIFVLMVITSTGIYGFLSDAYTSDRLSLDESEARLELVTESLSPIQKELDSIQADIDRIPDNYITKRQEMILFYKPRKEELLAKREQLNTEKIQLSNRITSEKAHIGPILFVAESLNIDVTDAIKYVMLMIIFVFDPLAVVLTICINTATTQKLPNTKKEKISFWKRFTKKKVKDNKQQTITEPYEYKPNNKKSVMITEPAAPLNNLVQGDSSTSEVGDPHQDEELSTMQIPFGNTSKKLD